jgi:hypothetical protein
MSELRQTSGPSLRPDLRQSSVLIQAKLQIQLGHKFWSISKVCCVKLEEQIQAKSQSSF